MKNKQFTFDRKEYSHYRFNTPIAPPQSQYDREALHPGTCVKCTIDNEVVCGIVHKNEPVSCVVIGHGWCDSDDEMFIWRGSKSEFDALWIID